VPKLVDNQLRPIVFKKNLVLDYPSNIAKMVGHVYQQYRSHCFLYLARGLDVCGHFTLGPKGSDAFDQNLQGYSLSVKRLDAGVDHVYNAGHPYQPVIVNTTSVAAPSRPHAHDSQPMLSRFQDTVVKGIENIEFMLKSASRNKRDTLSIHVGYTSVQACRWIRANDFDVAMPGFMKAMDGMPLSFLKWIGEIGVVLSHDLVLVGYGEEYGLFHASPERSAFSQKLAEKLGLTGDLVNLFLCEAVSLVLGDGTAWHFDDLNDNRPGHDHVSVGSVVMDFTQFGIPKVCGMLTSMGFEATGVTLTVIAYTRHICGVKVDQIEFRNNPHSSPALKALLQDLAAMGTEPPHFLLDVDYLNCEWFQQEILHHLSPSGPSTPYSGDYSVDTFFCPEGITKLFFYSSSVHIIWKFCFQYRRDILFGHLLQLWAFVSFECNEQTLFYEVMMDFIQGKYLGEMDKVSGLLQLGMDTNLYQMLSLEFMERMTPQKAGVRTEEHRAVRPQTSGKNQNPVCLSTTQCRFPISGSLLLLGSWIKGKGDCTSPPHNPVSSRINGLMELVSKCWKNILTPSAMYKSLQGSSFGVGHFQATQAIHLGALLGILPYSHFQFSAEDASSQGPFNFLKYHSGEKMTSFSNVDAKMEFSSLLGGVHSSGYTCFTRSHLEQYCWLKGKSYSGITHSDTIFCDQDDGCLQNFFRVGSTKRNKGCLEFYYCNTWTDFSTVVGPFFHGKDGLGMESKLHGYLHCTTYPQDPFKLLVGKTDSWD
jgi:hypothetical protein